MIPVRMAVSRATGRILASQAGDHASLAPVIAEALQNGADLQDVDARVISDAEFATALAAQIAASRRTGLTGHLLQEIVAESNAVNETATTNPYTNSSLSARITPIRNPSVIKITFDIPRADVSLISGSHSERTLAVRIFNETDGGVVGDAAILGRVLIGSSGAAATHTGSMHGVRYCNLVGTHERAFRLQFAVGIASITQARLRGDRGFFRLILQEMEMVQ